MLSISTQELVWNGGVSPRLSPRKYGEIPHPPLLIPSDYNMLTKY